MWKTRSILVVILIIGAVFRFTGLNWDSSQHLHPDERFLTMVATGISWPSSIGQYFDTANSPLNPHNKGFDFFVYGTFPVFLVKFVAEVLGRGDYVNLTLVGRAMSALTDMGTMMLVYFIARTLANKSDQEPRTNNQEPIWAMFAYSIMILPIQLSHFYATDPYLTFFLTLTLYLVILSLTKRDEGSLAHARTYSDKLRDSSTSLGMTTGLGLSFGLAIASKISAVYFLPVIAIFYIFQLIKYRHIRLTILQGILFVCMTLLTVKLAQPYLFTKFWSFALNPKVTANWQQLESFNGIGFPPAIQWISTIPYLHPLIQGFFWGVGPVMGGLIIMGLIILLLRLLFAGDAIEGPEMRFTWERLRRLWKDRLYFANQLNRVSGNERGRTRKILWIIVLLWLLVPFFIQGGQFAKAMRYFSPLYPVLAIFAGLGITTIFNSAKKINQSLYTFAFCLLPFALMIWPLSFLSIYLRPHTRVAATEWILDNVPEGTILSSDHWDDGLPLCLSADKCWQYVHEELHLFDPDTPEKWDGINEQLAKIDYLIITSNRTYGALGTVPDKFPLTNNFYRRLFNGELNFQKVAEFTSRPSLPIPIPLHIKYPFFNYGLTNYEPLTTSYELVFVDDYAEETWTVYDHPKVIIFRRED